jgi:AcrR family transcriptional regulator
MQVRTLTVMRTNVNDTARDILASDGAGSVTLGRIARELGVERSSLYQHFASEDELLGWLAADALLKQMCELESADQDLLAQAHAYRLFALEHPRRYRLITEFRLPLDAPPDALRARPPRAFLDQLGPDVARAAWAFMHGMVELELDERFPPDTDVDGAWRAGLAALGAIAAPQANGHNGSCVAGHPPLE